MSSVLRTFVKYWNNHYAIIAIIAQWLFQYLTFSTTFTEAKETPYDVPIQLLSLRCTIICRCPVPGVFLFSPVTAPPHPLPPPPSPSPWHDGVCIVGRWFSVKYWNNHYAIITIIAQWLFQCLTKVHNTEQQFIRFLLSYVRPSSVLVEESSFHAGFTVEQSVRLTVPTRR